MRVFRRCFASAKIPVSFSRGFNPHPRLSFGPSLRTGWEGLDEYMDVYLDAPSADFATCCNPYLPRGVRVLEAVVVGESVPKLSVDVSAVRYEVSLDGRDVFVGELVSDTESQPATGWEDDGQGSLERLKSLIRERFASAPRERASDGEAISSSPVLLEVGAYLARNGSGEPSMNKRITITYLSTMHGGRSLFPENILHPFLGDPTGYATPIRVVRKSLYVRRAGDYLSPISRAVVESRI
jgi:hypothetical protein